MAGQAVFFQAATFTIQPAVGEGADIGAVGVAKSTLTREAVRAEVVYAVRHGQRVGGEV